MNFIKRKYANCDWCFTEVCSWGSNNQYPIIGSDSGLAPTRRQAIFWNSDGKFTEAYKRHSASMSWLLICIDRRRIFMSKNWVVHVYLLAIKIYTYIHISYAFYLASRFIDTCHQIWELCEVYVWMKNIHSCVVYQYVIYVLWLSTEGPYHRLIN